MTGVQGQGDGAAPKGDVPAGANVLCPECGTFQPPRADGYCRNCGPKLVPPTGDALIAHFSVCDCHDSWDQCPCADSGHPADGSCDCCEFGIGLCGERP